MKLSVKNIGKIEYAEIDISGITVVGGLNNTGKSTLSKSLFAIFNSLHNLSGKVRQARLDSIIRVLRTYGNRFDEDWKRDEYIELASSLIGLTNGIDIEEVMIQYDVTKELYEAIIPRIMDYNNVSQEQIAKEIILSNFKDEFNNRIYNIFSEKEISEVLLSIKDEEFRIAIDSSTDDLDFVFSKQLDYEVVYIDDPFVIDSYRGRDILFASNNHRNLILRQYRRQEDLDFVEKATIRNRMSEVYSKIDTVLGDIDDIVVPGRGVRRLRRLQSEEASRKLSVDSLSSGLKTFYLIKALLDNGTIVENGTLILDEPEVHLHPSWQLNLAEIIVLLQRELNLHILINTHSPYFLRAIDVYSRKYEVAENTNYYLSTNFDKYAKVTKIDDLSEFYKVLAEPFQKLENEEI